MKKYILIFSLITQIFYAQKGTTPVGNTNSIESNLSPEGMLENVFDHYGNKYKLSDIVIGKEIRDAKGQLLRGTNPTPMTCGYYNLYFEDGSGMEDTSNSTHLERRAVVCQVFTDLSNFINSPLTTNGLNNRVNIWVRNINNVIVAPESSVGIPGLASSFYSMPYNTTAGFGGIVDNEVWKTIHTGVNSYTNVVSPLVSSGISSGTSGIFYHGMMAFNFTDTTTPINWNTNLSIASFPNLYDLYSVVLHEVVHSLGFASLINSSGTSLFNSGYSYYSRYDRFLKNKENTQFLLTSTGCKSGKAGSMYNYRFNSLLNASILQPPIASCSNSIIYVGTSNVQLFTPSVFSPFSSLSHFDGTCINPDPSFVLSSSIDTNVIRRFLKTQERNALADIGYSVNNSYGVNTTYQGTTTYSGGILNGVSVAGINDGIIPGGTFTYIGNASTPIVINSTTDTTKRILSNDTNAATNFECLEDVFDTTANISIISGSATTNVTFSSAVPGLHLLRYVPTNSTGTQKGNITYIYVYVNSINNCVSMNACDYIGNGNFESYSNLPSGISQINLSCGWFNANGGSADYFHSSATSSFVDVPCNLTGFENDNVLNNHAYAGMYFSVNDLFNNHQYESIRTRLKTPLSPNSIYQLSFDVSLAEGVSTLSNKFQAYLSNSIVVATGAGEIPITNYNMLKKNLTFSTTSNGWEKIVLVFKTNSIGGEEYLYLGGLDNVEEMAKPAAPLIGGCLYNINGSNRYAYYYIDNVSLIPLNGGSFVLPTTLCGTTQSLTNLNTYLDSLPTNGVFSGTGITFGGGVYSLNSNLSLSPGIITISYTYSNSSGCFVTVYSNIKVITCEPSNCPSNLTFSTPELATLETYQAANTIITNTNYIVNAGSTITLTAGNSITFNPLSEIKANSTSNFTAKIEACSPSSRKTNEKEKELIEEEKLTLYPNPTNEIITISTNNSNLKKISVYSIEGKMVYDKEIEKTNSHQLNVSSFQNGIYLALIETVEGKVYKEKIIKN